LPTKQKVLQDNHSSIILITHLPTSWRRWKGTES